jgi:SNF2 family DNA or RNA helicase
LPELPPIIEQSIEIELTNAQRSRYDEVWDQGHEQLTDGRRQGEAINILALITHLKQICNYDPDSGESAKLDALQDIVSSLVDKADKLLVFSQFVETLDWIAANLSIPCAVFHGGLTEGERERILDEFRISPGPRALLASIRAGGVGLNLQETTVVVMFDRWWNPAVESQAVSRAHRFGRTRPLLSYTFSVKNSIEERIERLLKEKSELAKQIVDGAAGVEVRQLTISDLRRLVDLPDVDQSVETVGDLT